MSKKRSKKKTNKNIYLLSAVLFLAALVLWFVLPALKWVVGDNVMGEYTFIQTVFGYKETALVEVTIFGFNVLGLIALILLALGLLVGVYHFAAKKSALKDYAKYLILLLGVTAGVLVFLSKRTLQIETVLIDVEKITLALGTYLVGSLTIAGGLAPFILELL